jgi:hypothetical protein
MQVECEAYSILHESNDPRVRDQPKYFYIESEEKTLKGTVPRKSV